MSNTEITAVRIDIYKDESTVAVCRPDGQIMLILFTALHMVGATTSGKIRIVMEHTGMRWQPAVSDALLFIISDFLKWVSC